MKKDGEGAWSLGRFVENPCAVCKKRGDSCLRVVINDFADIDLGACVWCKARSVGCSTAQCRGRGGVGKAKAKDEEDPKRKRKASEIDSKASEGKAPSPKKVKSRSVIEDSEEEWEGIEDKGDCPKESGEEQEVEEVREVMEEVWEEVTEEVWEEVTEEVREMDRREAKRARKEARRSERSEKMDELIDVVMGLGENVDKFAEEVRVSNVLRNRADREYLEERRRWYFSDRMMVRMWICRGIRYDCDGEK
jgi:hypothetical protein